MNILMFSGQGSQYHRMGHALYERQPVFRAHLDRLDRMAALLTGVSVVDSIYRSGRSADEPFDDIGVTNPAIFMVELALARTIADLGVRIDMTLGASLGSFAALVVSGVMDDRAALAAVIRMAAAAERSAPRGGMIAVIAPLALLDDPILRDNAEVAAVNFDSHFVVSVEARRIALVEAHLHARGILFQRLPVTFPFHSGAIDPLEGPARTMHADLSPRRAQIPFICCAHGTILMDLRPDYFWQLIRRPIQFRDTVLDLERQGTACYIDVGPSGTLATFLKYLLPNAGGRIRKIMDPFGDDCQNLAGLVQVCGAGERQFAAS